MTVVTHWIDGAEAPSSGDRSQAVLNPATGERIAQVLLGTAEDVDRAVASAAAAAQPWGQASVAKRAAVLFRFRELLAAYNTTLEPKARMKLLADMQKKLADDAANVYLFQLPQFAVARKPLKGLWSSSPIFANDLAALSW